MFKRIFVELKAVLSGIFGSLMEESVGAMEQELRELESAFLLLVLGSLVGVRTITPMMSLELLEALSDEIKLLEERAYRGEDVIGELMSALGGGS